MEIELRDDTEVVGKLTMNFAYDLMGGNLEVFYNLGITRYTSGRENTIVDSSVGARFDITDDIYLNLQYDLDRESNPAEGKLNTDTKFLLGFGIELD